MPPQRRRLSDIPGFGPALRIAAGVAVALLILGGAVVAVVALGAAFSRRSRFRWPRSRYSRRPPRTSPDGPRERRTCRRRPNALALAHPGVHLEARHGGRAVLTAPCARTLRDRVGALYGFETAGRLLEVAEGWRGRIRISGLVAPPQLARGNRDEMSLIVNDRPVRDTLLLQTVLDAYRPLLARDQFPVVVLRLDLPPQDVDVNVHPTKAWVRFRSPREVQEAVFVAVQSALRTAAVVPSQPGLTAPGAAPAAAAALLEGAEAASPAPVQGGLFREEPAPFGRGRFGDVTQITRGYFLHGRA